MKLKEEIIFIKTFGIWLWVLRLVRKMLYRSDHKISLGINALKEASVGKYLSNAFGRMNADLSEIYSFRNAGVGSEPIWVMWWQGEQEAPEVVKLCLSSIRQHCNYHQVYLITERNISEFIHLPEFIYEKWKKGIISRTHLSDIIRLSLLSLYGGAWIDSTVFLSEDIPDSYFQKEFFTIKTGKNSKDPSHGRWTTFLLFGKSGNRLISKTLEYHIGYWKVHNVIVDYIMFDFLIQYVCKTDPTSRRYIDEVSVNNSDVFKLRSLLNMPYIVWQEMNISKNTIFHKLSWKEKYCLDIENQMTVYGYLVKSYLY